MSRGFRARLNKVKAMPIAELAARAAYEGFVAVERHRVGSGARPATLRPDRLRRWRAAVDRRTKATRPRFFSGVECGETTRGLFGPSGPYARQAEAARRAANDAKEHRFEFFGQRFSYGAEIDWHADPVTGRPWPRVFHRDVPIHDRAAAPGDVKYVWELNRHQFLIDLGKAYWLFGDADAAACVYRIVRHWVEQNPYGVGVNWSCALEPAFRAWSWLWAYHFCEDDRALDEETRTIWLSAIYEHGHFLHRHLEYYASPYNHLIGEASALYALGVMFPEMPDADRWRHRGRRALEGSLARQFHPDGGSVEQSTFYHHATLGFYLLATLLGEANGDPFPSLEPSIERGIAFSMALLQPDGRVPSIGGADDGKCIRLEHRPFWDFRAFLAIGAVRCGRGDFRFAANDFAEDALWLLGPDGRERFSAIAPRVPEVSNALPASGYYVLRSNWSAEADYVCFDCGEQAAGLRRDDVPSAAHGHADCLSIVLWLRGRPVLMDPGFYCYNGDPAWEVHFRRTAAHNTASVGGLDQSRHLHKMAWTHVFEPHAEAWMPLGRGGAVGGSHDGFVRECGVLHRRAVWLSETGCCVICDQFTGRGSHDVEINYQFAPGAARLTGESTLQFDAADMAWVASTRVGAVLRCGDPVADGGWVAPSLGVTKPAPRLSLRFRFDEPAVTCLTLLAPRDPQGMPSAAYVVRQAAATLAIGLQNVDSATWFELPIPPSVASARDLIGALRVRSNDLVAPIPSLVQQGCSG